MINKFFDLNNNDDWSNIISNVYEKYNDSSITLKLSHLKNRYEYKYNNEYKHINIFEPSSILMDPIKNITFINTKNSNIFSIEETTASIYYNKAYEINTNINNILINDKPIIDDFINQITNKNNIKIYFDKEGYNTLLSSYNSFNKAKISFIISINNDKIILSSFLYNIDNTIYNDDNYNKLIDKI